MPPSWEAARSGFLALPTALAARPCPCAEALLPAGGIPGPIAFGWVIDKSCLLWQDQCGQQGSCFVYQNSAMSRYMLITGLLYKVSLPPRRSGTALGSPTAQTPAGTPGPPCSPVSRSRLLI